MKRVYKKKPITEIIIESIKRIGRLCPNFNEFENNCLLDDFIARVVEIKEHNSQLVFNRYYLPKAIVAILREEGYLITEQQAYPRATAMMLNDLANGTLTEFYRFT